MATTTKNGITLTEETPEEMADRFERGDVPGETTRVLVAPPGRPRLSDEDLVTVAFKVPASYGGEMDKAAASLNMTRSEFLRRAVERALA